eukprot:COSAG06_NODE_50218_length_320_cov_0.796380_1_plen_46_part_01
MFLSRASESLAMERTSEPISSGLFTMHQRAKWDVGSGYSGESGHVG